MTQFLQPDDYRVRGGLARAARLTPERRRAIARMGANARWHGGRKNEKVPTAAQSAASPKESPTAMSVAANSDQFQESHRFAKVGFYYLASPYTHPNPNVREHRYNEAMRISARLALDGYCVISPIVQCHEMAKKYRLPTDFRFWKKWNEHLIRASIGIIVLRLDGWKESSGVIDEMEFAESRMMTIIEIDP